MSFLGSLIFEMRWLTRTRGSPIRVVWLVSKLTSNLSLPPVQDPKFTLILPDFYIGSEDCFQVLMLFLQALYQATTSPAHLCLSVGL